MPDELQWCPDCGQPLEVEPIAAETAWGDSRLTVAYSCPLHGPVALVDPV
jgi:hypothetical protein